MSSTLNSYVTNWFRVTDPDELKRLVAKASFNCTSFGEDIRLHHNDGKYRITVYDAYDASFTYYDENDPVCQKYGESISLDESLAKLLAEGEVFRVSTIVWFKGRLDYLNVTVHTWDGRSASRGLETIHGELAKELGLDEKQFDGYGW